MDDYGQEFYEPEFYEFEPSGQIGRVPSTSSSFSDQQYAAMSYDSFIDGYCSTQDYEPTTDYYQPPYEQQPIYEQQPVFEQQNYEQHPFYGQHPSYLLKPLSGDSPSYVLHPVYRPRRRNYHVQQSYIPQRVPDSGKAIASVVLGIICLIFLGCLTWAGLFTIIPGVIGLLLAKRARKELFPTRSNLVNAGYFLNTIGIALSSLSALVFLFAYIFN